MNTISYEKLKSMYENNEVFTLIDVLPQKHFDNVHCKKAINICVYETSFISSVNELELEKNSRIILYGNNDEDIDAKAGYEKLLLEEYTNIFYLKNGLLGIDEVLLEGKNLFIDEEQKFEPVNKNFQLLINNTLTWKGKNVNGFHKGIINFTSGFINFEDKLLNGEFIVDMKSIKNTDLNEEQGRDYLNAHLNSEDFFFTKFFPEAKFSFSNISLNSEAYLTSNNCTLEGMLDIKGISKTFVCSVNLSFLEEKLILSSSFSFDRTFWNVIYGSSKFFKYLGMHKVFDEINIDLRLELE